jgi:hypothetical protein
MKTFFGRFAQAIEFFYIAPERRQDYVATDCDLSKEYMNLVAYDATQIPYCVPLLLANKRDEINAYGVKGFIQHFGGVASIIAHPGQGKSRLASAVYNIMRGTNEPYFKVSESAVSYTKGVWRLSDDYKLKASSNDTIDILDVEGLQKENSVYYLLVSVVVLSKAIILLSRERVNKEALGVLEIAFKMLATLGIALKKPTIFIQAKMDESGALLDAEERPVLREELLRVIAKEIPIVKNFEVQFFSLTEIPVQRTLERAGANVALSEMLVTNATRLYTADVKTLLDRLVAVKDPLPSEQRMQYLIKVLEHLNCNNPDLVLEQNLQFFTRDAKRWLVTKVFREKEHLVQTHLNKPLGDAKTLKEFFEVPKETLRDEFFRYCFDESPFLGDTKNVAAFRSRAESVFNESEYAKGVLTATDPTTGEVIGIMSYVLPSFEAKKTTDERVLENIYNALREAAENGSKFDIIMGTLPDRPPESCVSAIKQSHTSLEDMDGIIADRWNQVRMDIENRKNTRLSESKWVQKARSEGENG